MAFSNTFDTTNPGSATGDREDLSGTYLLAPQETPVLSLAPKVKATARTHDWTVDGLAAVSTTAVAEGSDVTAFSDKFAAKARLSNQCTKRRRSYMVSDIQEAVESDGPVNLAQAELKSIKETKRDIETMLCGAQDRATEDGAGTASQSRGLGSWLVSTGPSDVPAAYRTPAASCHTTGTLAETGAASFGTIITSMFRQNGSVNDVTLVADTALRTVISGFALTAGSTNTVYRKINQNAESKTIQFQVEMYQSDHGMVSIVNMNPACAPDTTNADTGYLLNFDYLAVADLIPLGSTPVPNLGGGQRGYVDWVGTLEMRHPAAHGSITAIA